MYAFLFFHAFCRVSAPGGGNIHQKRSVKFV